LILNLKKRKKAIIVGDENEVCAKNEEKHESEKNALIIWER
jgi:hypothetical protein